jgi:hypothetical protein
MTPRVSNEKWNKQEVKNSKSILIYNMIKDCKRDIVFWSEILDKKVIEEDVRIYCQSEILEKQKTLIKLEEDLKNIN